MCSSTIDDVAIFFDFENIWISLRNQSGKNPDFQLIMDWFSQFGRVVFSQAYADWKIHNSFTRPLEESGFVPVFVPTYTIGKNGQQTVKNAVDMHIAVDATELLYTHPNIQVFGLLAGDKDYLPLVNRLRSRGKTVVVLSVESCTSKRLEGAVDKLVYYKQIVPKAPKNVPEIFLTLKTAVTQLETEGKRTILTAIKQKMRTILGSFNEKEHKRPDGKPFKKFLDFVQEAEQLGLVKLIKNDSGYEVKLA